MAMEKRTVLILAPCGENRREQFQKAYGERCDLFFEEDREAALSQAEVIIGAPGEADLQKAKNLRWLQLSWAGVDAYAKMQRFPKDVLVTNVSGAFGVIIYEYVVAGIVAQYRGFGVYRDNQKKHLWRQRDESSTVFGKRAVILGMGDLGSNVAKRLAVFGAHPVGVRRTVKDALPPFFEAQVPIENLDEALIHADILINCLPATRETSGLLTRERLDKLKKGALFVNVGRGSIVKNDDLVYALQNKQLRGAVLDVLEKEPLPEDSPLWDMENVLVTPHIAGPSDTENEDVRGAIWAICLENLSRYLTGKPLRHVVDLKTGY